MLTYSFDKRLIEILRDSVVWGKIAIPVLMVFTSKYAVSLYENIAQFSNLTHKTSEERHQAGRGGSERAGALRPPRALAGLAEHVIDPKPSLERHERQGKALLKAGERADCQDPE